MSRLTRILETAKSIYEVISEKAAEVRITVATETGTIKIVSLAQEPNQPVGLGKKQIIGIGAIFGLFIGIFVAFFAEYWERTKRVK